MNLYITSFLNHFYVIYRHDEVGKVVAIGIAGEWWGIQGIEKVEGRTFGVVKVGGGKGQEMLGRWQWGDAAGGREVSWGQIL